MIDIVFILDIGSFIKIYIFRRIILNGFIILFFIGYWKIANSVIFVFYTFKQIDSWTYSKFPKGWVWTGSGLTTPMNSIKKVLYEREEQFNGPKENRDQMKVYLQKIFEGLKKKGILERYKIRFTYRP